MSRMKVMLVAGARPNFAKIASIIEAITLHNRGALSPIDHVLVHTGQHYDEHLSQAFFKDLHLPRPDVDLEVGSASHAHQTAEIMKRFEPVILREQPDVVIVVGDVNSTVACALVAAKTAYPQSTPTLQRLRPLVAHVEAGLRSFDRSMPEEINRILTDAISDVLFITEESAEENLLREGIAKEKIYFVGNTMVDTLLKHRQKAQESTILLQLGLKTNAAASQGISGAERYTTPHASGFQIRDYAVVTLHRPSNVDDPATFQGILEALAALARAMPILFPMHPRTLRRVKEFRLEAYFASMTANASLTAGHSCISDLEPLGYLDFLCLMSNAKLVLTDSGGIQEETTVLGIPCVTLRENTERPVTLTQGTNVLAGTRKEAIIDQALNQLNSPTHPREPPCWDGRAGERIITALTRRLG
ncbi:MAG: non-hydrolyzing UDP-N-acetylglucosamine 2-epimerase [Candidatus Entotheonellia bacterium]